jgi:DNA-binding CsgD family transcriptional regulator
VLRERLRQLSPPPPISAEGFKAMNPPQIFEPHLAHRPTDLAALAREAKRLAAQGLTPRDVGELLGIGTGAAAALLGAARTHHESYRRHA